jgi:hypothetical protein
MIGNPFRLARLKDAEKSSQRSHSCVGKPMATFGKRKWTIVLISASVIFWALARLLPSGDRASLVLGTTSSVPVELACSAGLSCTQIGAVVILIEEPNHLTTEGFALVFGGGPGGNEFENLGLLQTDLSRREIRHPRLVAIEFPDERDDQICRTFTRRCVESRNVESRVSRAVEYVEQARLPVRFVVGQSYGSRTAFRVAASLQRPLLLDSPFDFSSRPFRSVFAEFLQQQEQVLTDEVALRFGIEFASVERALIALSQQHGRSFEADLLNGGEGLAIQDKKLSWRQPSNLTQQPSPQYLAEVCEPSRQTPDEERPQILLETLRIFGVTCDRPHHSNVSPRQRLEGTVRCARTDSRILLQWCEHATQDGLAVSLEPGSKHTGLLTQHDWNT